MFCMVCKLKQNPKNTNDGSQFICGNCICTKCMLKNLNLKFTCPYCSQVHEIMPDLLLTNNSLFKDKRIDNSHYDLIQTEIYLRFKKLVDYLNSYILSMIGNTSSQNENLLDLKSACDNLRLQVRFHAQHAIIHFKQLEKILQGEISFKFEKLIKRQLSLSTGYANTNYAQSDLKTKRGYSPFRKTSNTQREENQQSTVKVIHIIDYKSCKLTFNNLFKVNCILNLTQNFYIFCIAPFHTSRHLLQIVDLTRKNVIHERKIADNYHYRKMCVRNSLILIGFKLKPFEKHHKNELQLYDSNLKLRNSLKIDYELSSFYMTDDLDTFVTSLSDPVNLRLYNINLEICKIFTFKYDVYGSMRLKFNEFYRGDFHVISHSKKLFIEDQYSLISVLSLHENSELSLLNQISLKHYVDFELVHVSQDSLIYLLNKSSKILIVLDENSMNILGEFNLTDYCTQIQHVSSFFVSQNQNTVITLCDYINCKIVCLQLNFAHHY